MEYLVCSAGFEAPYARNLLMRRHNNASARSHVLYYVPCNTLLDDSAPKFVANKGAPTFNLDSPHLVVHSDGAERA